MCINNYRNNVITSILPSYLLDWLYNACIKSEYYYILLSNNQQMNLTNCDFLKKIKGEISFSKARMPSDSLQCPYISSKVD